MTGDATACAHVSQPAAEGCGCSGCFKGCAVGCGTGVLAVLALVGGLAWWAHTPFPAPPYRDFLHRGQTAAIRLRPGPAIPVLFDSAERIQRRVAEMRFANLSANTRERAVEARTDEWRGTADGVRKYIEECRLTAPSGTDSSAGIFLDVIGRDLGPVYVLNLGRHGWIAQLLFAVATRIARGAKTARHGSATIFVTDEPKKGITFHKGHFVGGPLTGVERAVDTLDGTHTPVEGFFLANHWFDDSKVDVTGVVENRSGSLRRFLHALWVEGMVLRSRPTGETTTSEKEATRADAALREDLWGRTVFQPEWDCLEGALFSLRVPSRQRAELFLALVPRDDLYEAEARALATSLAERIGEATGFAVHSEAPTKGSGQWAVQLSSDDLEPFLARLEEMWATQIEVKPVTMERPAPKG